MIVIDLDDRATAFHLAACLDLWARKCREAEPRVPFPSALEALRRRAWTRVNGDSEGPTGTPLPPLTGLTDTPRMLLWLTVNDVAGSLSVSDKTVKRWIADGTLRSFRVGGARRLHVRDVADFAERRGGGVNVTDDVRIEGDEGATPAPVDSPAPAPTAAA